jgi:hypothetical protein
MITDPTTPEGKAYWQALEELDGTVSSRFVTAEQRIEQLEREVWTLRTAVDRLEHMTVRLDVAMDRHERIEH